MTGSDERRRSPIPAYPVGWCAATIVAAIVGFAFAVATMTRGRSQPPSLVWHIIADPDSDDWALIDHRGPFDPDRAVGNIFLIASHRRTEHPYVTSRKRDLVMFIKWDTDRPPPRRADVHRLAALAIADVDQSRYPFGGIPPMPVAMSRSNDLHSWTIEFSADRFTLDFAGIIASTVLWGTGVTFIVALGQWAEGRSRRQRWQRWRAVVEGVCPDCRYDLGGTEHAVCPECGLVLLTCRPDR